MKAIHCSILNYATPLWTTFLSDNKWKELLIEQCTRSRYQALPHYEPSSQTDNSRNLPYYPNQ